MTDDKSGETIEEEMPSYRIVSCRIVLARLCYERGLFSAFSYGRGHVVSSNSAGH